MKNFLFISILFLSISCSNDPDYTNNLVRTEWNGSQEFINPLQTVKADYNIDFYNDVACKFNKRIITTNSKGELVSDIKDQMIAKFYVDEKNGTVEINGRDIPGNDNSKKGVYRGTYNDSIMQLTNIDNADDIIKLVKSN